MAALDPYGTDLDGITDLTPTLREVSGQEGVAQAVARRWLSGAGELWYDPAYGSGMMRWLNASVGNYRRLEGDLRSQALQDERVTEAVVVVGFDAETSSLRVSARLTLSNDENFSFSVTHDSVTSKLLMGS